MHDTILSDAFAPEPVTVLGLPLLPYAIGHELMLIRKRSRLLFYKLDDLCKLQVEEKARCLAEAVLVCYRDGDKAASKLAGNQARWARMVKDLNLNEELRKFTKYREDGTRDLPAEKMPRQQGTPFHYFGAPEMARLINYVSTHHLALIQAHFGGSPLNFPVSLACILHSTHLESEGAVWIQNYKDIETAKKREEASKSNTGQVLMGSEAETLCAELTKKNTRN